MKRAIWLWALCAAAFTAGSCGKRAIPPALLPPPRILPEMPEIATVFAEPEATDADEETDEAVFEEYFIPHRIIIPYNREYLSPGQETRITVLLENADYGDEMYFEFTKEPGKNRIEVDGIYNIAVIKAIGEGEQYLRVSHPKAQESRFIVYDVLPPSPAGN